jgi:hypothetical protein
MRPSLLFRRLPRAAWFSLALAILLALGPTAPYAHSQVVPPPTFPITISGGGATWTFDNFLGINTFFNQLEPGRPGFGLDAAFLTGNINTALDTSYTLWLDGQQFIAAEPLTATANSLTIGPVITAGLAVQLQFEAFGDRPALRALISLHNPGAADVARSIRVINNVASNNLTIIPDGGTSSGDGLLTVQDRWAVTSEDRQPLLNPVNVHVFAGPGSPPALPAVVATRVFLDPPGELDPGSTGLNGVGVTFNLTIPAGATRRLLLFHQLASSNETALTEAARYSAFWRKSETLLGGLSTLEMSEVANWGLPAYEVFLPLVQR